MPTRPPKQSTRPTTKVHSEPTGRKSNKAVSLPVIATLPVKNSEQFAAILKETSEIAAAMNGLGVEINVFINTNVVNIYGKNTRQARNIVAGALHMNERTNINADRGAVVGYKSTLTNVEAMYQASSDDSPEAHTVKQQIEAFAKMLSQIDEKHADAVQLLSQRLEELATQTTKPPEQRKKGLLELSAKGLKDAVVTLGEIAPGMLQIAENIVAAITNWS